MFCDKCGFQLKDDAKFCPRCGTSVLNVDAFKGAETTDNSVGIAEEAKIGNGSFEGNGTIPPININHGNNNRQGSGTTPEGGSFIGKGFNPGNGTPPERRPSPPPVKKPENKKDVKPWVIIGSVAAVVIVAAVIILLSTNRTKPIDTVPPIDNQPMMIIDAEDSDRSINSSQQEKPAEKATEKTTEKTTEAPTKSAETVISKVEYETTKKEVSAAKSFRKATASSVLPDQQGHKYSASNVLVKDGTCWCEDASDYGEGEWIKLELPELQRVSGLKIINGYAGTEAQYDNNSKPSEIEIEFSNGVSTKVRLNVFGTSERKTVQNIEFNAPVDTEYVKITILSVKKGEMKDTCLTYVEPY